MRNDPPAPNPWIKWAVSSLAALVFLTLLWGVFWGQISAKSPPIEPRERAHLTFSGHRTPPPPKTKKEVELVPKDAQIVEVAQPDQDIPPDPDTKYVADKRTKTKRETRSKHRDRPDTSKEASQRSPKKASEVQSKASTSDKETAAPKSPDEKVELARPSDDHMKADSGQRKTDPSITPGDARRILLPPSTRAAALANYQALSGVFASDDYTPDLPKDNSTVLNANSYRFADFFYRVKRAVRPHWHPREVYEKRDPTGRVYGVKDRYTQVHVTLDKQGNIKKLILLKHCGLGFLDTEAKEAFRRAGPFKNPPAGLINKHGNVVFSFGFFFEIGTGKRRFKWKPG